MSILLISSKSTDGWFKAIKEENEEIEVEVYPDVKDKDAIEYALVWNHPPGVFDEFPNIKVISSMGAGVDHITRDPKLPEDVTITRIVDDQLAIDMAEFVLARSMAHLRNLSLHQRFAEKQEWKPKSYKRIADVQAGILGMGNLGITVGEKLADAGFKVRGWSRSEKHLEDINSFAGREELDEFLSGTDILICLLPLTSETEDILNKELFQKLPKGAFLINAARGNHLVEDDLLEMIDSEHLSGAALDVFREEPLPEGHPFWTHHQIQVTPHNASVSQPSSAVPQVLENYERMKNGKELLNVVDRERGY